MGVVKADQKILISCEANQLLSHVGHVLCKQCVVLPLPILTFIFLLVSPTGLARSEEDKYQLEDKEPLYNCAHDLS